MNPGKVVLVTLLAGGISIGAAVFGERWVGRPHSSPQRPAVSPAQIQSLPDFRLPDLSGREISSNAWAGKTLVLNYWASWCPPCLREMPMMIRTQEALQGRGVQFVGVALDREQDVQSFVAEYPLNYPVLIGNPESVELSRRLGNRLQGLPFTVIFDSKGRRVFSRTGEISEQELMAELNAVLTDTPPEAPPPHKDIPKTPS